MSPIDEILGGYHGLQAAQEAFYQDLHSRPELSHAEHRTAQRVADQLRTTGFTVHAGIGGTGVGAPRGAVVPDGGERPSISSPSQRWGEAGGSLSRGSPGRAGAASTKSRRPGTAGWAGRGEQDGKVYARNRLRYASSRAASSNPADSGWFAVRTRPS